MFENSGNIKNSISSTNMNSSNEEVIRSQGAIPISESSKMSIHGSIDANAIPVDRRPMIEKLFFLTQIPVKAAACCTRRHKYGLGRVVNFLFASPKHSVGQYQFPIRHDNNRRK